MLINIRFIKGINLPISCIFTLFCLLLSSCSQQITSELPINEDITHLLKIMGYQECNITSLADYENLTSFFDISNDEFTSRVDEIFQQHPLEIKSDKQFYGVQKFHEKSCGTFYILSHYSFLPVQNIPELERG